MNIRHRAYAYVTKGRRLLLFTQPEAPELSGNCGDKIELLRESMG